MTLLNDVLNSGKIIFEVGNAEAEAAVKSALSAMGSTASGQAVLSSFLASDRNFDLR